MCAKSCIALLHAGRANEASSGVDELKALDVTVTGLQLERTIERGQAQVADTRARYESSSQSEPTVQKAVKKKKVRGLGAELWASNLIAAHSGTWRLW